MARSVRRTAEFTVRLPRDAAMALFTPEGERSWAAHDGWDPHYPDPSRTTGPGTVFVTTDEGPDKYWVMVDHTADRVRYARVTPAHLAGTVQVEAVASTMDTTRVRVSYDMTALRDEAVAELDAFAARYDAMIAAWDAAIAQVIAARPHPDPDR